MKKIFLMMPFVSILLYTGACKVSKKQSEETLLEDKRQLIKEYGLCSCLALVGKQDTTFQNDISKTVYVESTDYNRVDTRNIYNAVDSLAYKAFNLIAPTQVADYIGRKPYMKSCIEFSKSVELDSLIRSYDAEIQIDPE
jgi:hypothetical protein